MLLSLETYNDIPLEKIVPRTSPSDNRVRDETFDTGSLLARL